MINKFLNPKTIAVIGASKNPQKVGYALMDNLKDFNGKVIPINPKLKYKSVLDYNEVIDLAIIAIPTSFVNNALAQCGKKKIKNVIVISAGFSEVGNKKAEQEILRTAKKYNIRILGPNCFGIANPFIKLDTTFSKTSVKSGNIAFISQSGALWSYISDLSESADIGFSGFVSLGNMSDLNFSEFLEYFSKDKKTKSIILYIEKLKDGKRFMEAAKRCKKPIYAIKAGKSNEGAKAAISHTGSLATDYEIYKGAFKQSGIILCESLEEALEKASKKQIKIKQSKLSRINEAVVITNAGGAGALVADYLSEKQIQIKGPYDILGTAKSNDYLEAFKKYNKSNNFIIIMTPQTMTDVVEIAKIIVEFKKENGNKQIICCFLGKRDNSLNDIFKRSKIHYYNTLKEFRKSL